jgi:hypothetical protein
VLAEKQYRSGEGRVSPYLQIAALPAGGSDGRLKVQMPQLTSGPVLNNFEPQIVAAALQET